MLQLPVVIIITLGKKLQTTTMLANLTHIADPADCSLVLGVVLGPAERTYLERSAAVDGRVAGSTDLELGELIKLNLYRVVGVTLALSLCLLRLLRVVSFEIP